jgi:enamine deaminase RidA (YjgF/YER057c/UK114 family)
MAGIARISSGAPWEPIFGYVRSVKCGGWLAVSGTTSIDENGRILGRNQMYVQARQAIANIEAVLEGAGMTLADVVRTRVFVTDMQRFPEVARAHFEAFGDNPPAATVVEIRRLVNPDMMIEIEADAFQAQEVATVEVIDEAIEVVAIPVAASAIPRSSRPLDAEAVAAAKSRPSAKSKVVAKPQMAKAKSAKTKPAKMMSSKTTKARKKMTANLPRKPAGKRR